MSLSISRNLIRIANQENANFQSKSNHFPLLKNLFCKVLCFKRQAAKSMSPKYFLAIILDFLFFFQGFCANYIPSIGPTYAIPDTVNPIPFALSATQETILGFLQNFEKGIICIEAERCFSDRPCGYLFRLTQTASKLRQRSRSNSNAQCSASSFLIFQIGSF